MNVSPSEIPPTAAGGEVFPLSFAQERLWFLQQLEGGCAYNVPLRISLPSDLNISRLQDSIEQIVRRHAVLRAKFIEVGGKPMQVISQDVKVDFPRVSLEDWGERDAKLEFLRIARKESKEPFDLRCGPLFRVNLIRLRDKTYVLLITMHHIVCDGWSTEILIRELLTLYDAFSKGAPSPLPELPIQYIDYARWQKQRFQGKELEAEIGFWREQLFGAAPVLELPADHARPAVKTFQGAAHHFVLPFRVLRDLKVLAQRERCTLFMVLLAAFKVLLYRYTGQKDVIVGSPVANRTRSEVENLVGFFVNTLVLRTNLSDNPSFLELLARVREVSIAAYAHQEVPFEKIVESLRPHRSLSYTPLFQVMFSLQSTSTPAVSLAKPAHADTREQNSVNTEDSSSTNVDTETSKFDLLLSMAETTIGLEGVWEYSTDLFERSTIERFTGHYRTILDGVLANPGALISELPVLTEAERRQLLIEWNATETDQKEERCLHQLIEAQVALTPNSIAVVFGGESLTYGELNVHANRLAHYLRSKGIGPEVRVGICMERSLEMVIGLLAVFKAGGTYVPLDPAYPRERLEYMLQDAQLHLVLAQQQTSNSVSKQALTVILDGVDQALLLQQPTENLPNLATSANTAYILYTSGSTGQPRGVMMPHRGICNLISWMQHDVGGSSMRTLQFASCSFDVSLQEIVFTLATSGILVLCSVDCQRDPTLMTRIIEQSSVAQLFVTPLVLQHLCDHWIRHGGAPTSLRRVVCAGEPLLISDEMKAAFCFNQITLSNQYGPTETHVVTGHNCNSLSPSEDAPPIGRPISNCKLYVLDERMQVVPIGVIGELYIGGRCLAHGYLNRPALTAERFVPDPFCGNGDGKLYRTGDFVRYRPDGNVEFIGRMDDQVKVRGFRIELGEIEARLAEHPLIQKAVVVAREDNPGDKRLVAYVAAKGKDLSTSSLRSYLRERLPEYMLPSVVVFLPTLPLLPNGKIDRAALPAPGQIRPQLETAFAEPATKLERELSNVWRSVLHLESVGVDDNFFDLGGHSLLATQLVSRIRDTLSIDVPLRSIFEFPSISSLAEAMANSAGGTIIVPSPIIGSGRRPSIGP